MNTHSQETKLATSGYLRRFKLAQMLNINVSTLDRWVKNGLIPSPVRLGQRTTLFRVSDINEWLKTQ